MRRNQISVGYALAIGCLLIQLFINSCNEESDINLDYYLPSESTTYLGASNGSLTFDYEGRDNQRLDVKAKNVKWEITGVPSWLTVTPTYGNTNGNVYVKCTPNSGNQHRSATLHLKSTNAAFDFAYDIKVTQNAQGAPIAIVGLSQTGMDYLTNDSDEYKFKYHWSISLKSEIDNVVEMGFENKDATWRFCSNDTIGNMRFYNKDKMWTRSSRHDVYYSIRGYAMCSDSTFYYTDYTDFFLYDFDY